MSFYKPDIRKATKIAFDTDLTLIDHQDRPLYNNINLLNWFIEKGYDCIMWSGGGIDYCEMWSRKLGFEGKVRVIAKGSEEVDLAFDDECVNLGKTNIIV